MLSLHPFLDLSPDMHPIQTTYHFHWIAKGALECEVGRELISTDGEAHKRQRKSIKPGFTSAKIREYSDMFSDCAHKVWDIHQRLS